MTALQHLLRLPVDGLAYPHGAHRAPTMRAAQEAGYAYAAAGKDACSHPADDRWALARLTVKRDRDPASVLDWAQTAPLAWRRPRLRTLAHWRVRRPRREPAVQP